MIALLQRVTFASVVVDEAIVGEIKQGLLVFLGVEKDDRQTQADRLLEKILGYRMFADEQDKMNLSVRDIAGGLLIVPQFTLAADTKSGLRPSFSAAAIPAEGELLYDYFVVCAKSGHDTVETGQFGADMKVSLLNDGPVTFHLKI